MLCKSCLGLLVAAPSAAGGGGWKQPVSNISWARMFRRSAHRCSRGRTPATKRWPWGEKLSRPCKPRGVFRRWAGLLANGGLVLHGNWRRFFCFNFIIGLNKSKANINILYFFRFNYKKLA